MSYYDATINPGPGSYAIRVVADHAPSGAVVCTITLGDKAATDLRVTDLDALIVSLQAARGYVKQ